MLIQRSLDLGIEMNLVRKSDTRAIAYCILGAIKEVVSLLSRTPESDTPRWSRRSWISACAGSRGPSCWRPPSAPDNGASGAGFLFARN